MNTLKEIVTKTWIFVAGVVLILGSSSAMAFALDRNVPASATANVVTTNAKETINSSSLGTGVTAEYSVTDLSKTGPERAGQIKRKLSMIKDITPEQIEEKYNTIIANLTPGAKDISAGQAATYAADILEKAYKVDFKGYTAEANFSRNPIPNSDNWTVIFHSPEEIQNKDQQRFAKSYIASVNSVNGTMQNASFFDPDYDTYDTYINKNLNDPLWMEKAEQAISAILPKNVTISSSKVISALPEGGITVVSELSDGSACSVRLTGENKEALAYVFFPNGYDESLNFNPATDKAVG